MMGNAHALLSMLALTAAVMAAPSWAADWTEQTGGWVIGRSGDSCVMHIEYEGEGTTELSLLIEGDASRTALIVGNQRWSTEAGKEYELRFYLGEWVYTKVAYGGQSSTRNGFST